jgi:C-terminal processing protease CtpA/Prc
MKKIVLAITLLAAFSSCEKAFFKKKGESLDAKANFDYLWQEYNMRYAYFDYKKIDWDNVYSKYAPRVYNGMSDDSLFNVMGAMLNELRDGHVNLISPFNISVFDIDLLGPDNIDDRVILENYIGTGRVITGPFTHSFLNNKQIGYVRFPSFTGSVNEHQLDYILDRYKDTKGLIFDIRQNGGGVINDAYTILGRFIDKDTYVYQSRGKTGARHNEFGEPEKSTLAPSESNVKYLKKIVVLTDRGTYSSGSFFTLMAKAIDYMIVLGDTTGGGLGLPNGGQLPNGWTYRCSITQTLDVHGNNYENGIPPDKRVVVTKAGLAAGIDDVLEAAMDEIK